MNLDFNYIDGFVIITLIYSFFTGFSKGFIIAVSSFVALILGGIGAVYFSDQMTEILQSKTQIDAQYISISSFAITFISIVFGTRFIAIIINQVIKLAALGLINKIMGGIFGMLKTVVILSVAFYIFDFVNSKFELVSDYTIHESIAYIELIKITHALLPLITESQWYTPTELEGALKYDRWRG